MNNPNGGEEIACRSLEVIMEEIASLDAESAEVLGNIKALLARTFRTAAFSRNQRWTG